MASLKDKFTGCIAPSLPVVAVAEIEKLIKH